MNKQLQRELDRRKPGGDRYEAMYATRRIYTFVPQTIPVTLEGRIGKRRT